MADSKITALTSISTSSDPANDPLVIVDVSDTSMAATGTTKKVTLNQLLATSPTATLASATITGDLTAQGTQVKLANQAAADCTVLIGPDSPSATRSGRIGFITSSTAKNWFIANNWNIPGGFEITQSTAAGGSTMSSNPTLRINNNSDFLFLDGAGGTRMTLNSTGLGVGVVPAAAFHAKKTLTGTASAVTNILRLDSGGSGNTAKITLTDGVTAAGYITMTGGAAADQILGFGVNNVNQMVVNSSGNVGIGVTPVYKLDTYTTLNGTVSEKRFANRTSNKILVKRYFSISADTALFSIECGTAGSANMAAFEINVFATGTKSGVSSDRQFYGKFYVTRNLAGTFTITSAFSSGSSGAFTVAASGTSLNVNGIFSVISDGSACVEITGYIGGRDTIAEANLTVTMP